MRIPWLLLLGVVAGCGPLKNPFDSLGAGSCTQDADCVVASCPNACNHGQPFCTYPKVHARADVAKACPCVDTPQSASCAAPSLEACGPLPGCAVPADFNQLRATCESGACAARLPDGGVPP